MTEKEEKRAKELLEIFKKLDEESRISVFAGAKTLLIKQELEQSERTA
jgi:hypothetical protein